MTARSIDCSRRAIGDTHRSSTYIRRWANEDWVKLSQAWLQFLLERNQRRRIRARHARATCAHVGCELLDDDAKQFARLTIECRDGLLGQPDAVRRTCLTHDLRTSRFFDGRLVRYVPQLDWRFWRARRLYDF
jgi:hypothetical protein